MAPEFQSFLDNVVARDRRHLIAELPRWNHSRETGSIATACLARSSSPLSPTTHSRSNGDFPVLAASSRCQARQPRGGCPGRLCADAAAGLYRAAQAERSLETGGRGASAPRATVPVVADFLAAARQEFKFVPRQPQSESEFKRAYATVALAAGLNKQQIVRIYSFEAGGNGGYDVQAGLEHDKSARAITTALGYNQLLATNSVEVVAESGHHFVAALLARTAALPSVEKAALERKIAVLRKMIGFARSVPDAWNEHQALANTAKGLAVHALNLDVDIGPYLQTQIADVIIDQGLQKYHAYAASSTLLNVETLDVVRIGSCYENIRYVVERHFGVALPRAVQPSAAPAQ